MDFIEKHPCIAVSIAGVLICILTCFIEELMITGVRLAGIVIFGSLIYWYIGILLAALLFAFNIAAMNAVKNESDAGIIFALLFGSVGAMIGLSYNPKYFSKNAVKIIFTIQLWVVIWLVVSEVRLYISIL